MWRAANKAWEMLIGPARPSGGGASLPAHTCELGKQEAEAPDRK